MTSGPGAQEGEDLERASLISSSVRGVAERFLFRRPVLGRGSLGGKKWSRSALLIATGLEAWGREGNLGVFPAATSCLAVHMLSEEVFARKSAQYVALALLMALKLPPKSHAPRVPLYRGSSLNPNPA